MEIINFLVMFFQIKFNELQTISGTNEKEVSINSRYLNVNK